MARLYYDYAKKLTLDYKNELTLDHTEKITPEYTEKVKAQVKHYCEKSRKCCDTYIVKANENELSYDDYNDMAVVYKNLGDFEESKELKQVFYEKAVYEHSRAIEILKSTSFSDFNTFLEFNAILLSNRGNVKEILGMTKECLKDLIMAELSFSDEKNINRIMDLIKKDIKWIDYCVQLILKENDNKLKGKNLIKKLEEYMEGIKEINPEIAVSLEKLNQ